MKSLKRLLVTIIAVTFVLSSAMVTVKAAPATDLKTMQVYSVDTAGAKKQLKFKFKPTTYKYDFVVKSNCVRIEILVTTKDPTSTAVVDKEAVNTRMDTGKNKTTVTVTATNGAKQVYTLKTKKCTPAEDSQYKEGGKAAKKTKTTKVSKKSGKIDINGKEYKVASFSKKDIPRGFEKTTAKYKGKSYDAIKGKEKDLTAFYLSGDDGEKFFIYDKEKDKLYPMNNVKIKSRMYTIVEPEKKDSFLDEYAKKKVEIGDQKVDAWVLDDESDDEKGIYLVYAMNWDGDTSLYTYDDQEKCMQRYLVDNNVHNQIDAANKAYDSMKAKRNALVKKYNIFRYIIIAMAIIIIILLFILIHRRLRRKEKKIKDEEFVTAGMGEDKKKNKKDKKQGDSDEEDKKDEPEEDKKEEPDEDDIDYVPETSDDEKIVEEGDEDEDEILDLDEDDDDDDIDAVPDENIEVDADEIQIEPAEDFLDDDVKAETPETIQEPEVIEKEPEEIEPITPVEVEKPAEEPKEEPKEEPVEETHKKKRDFSRRHEGYGDEPTFGTDKESTEGFYGGEVRAEEDVLVDLSEDDGPELAEPIENMAEQREIVDTSEIDVDGLSEPDDLKSTLKSMLQLDEEDNLDEEDDFEFIDLD